MPTFQTILHPTDLTNDSEAAFELACALARDYGGHLILLHVIPPSTAPIVEEGAEHSQEAIRRRFAWPQLPDTRISVEYRVGEGEPVGEILRFAHRISVDVIVLSTHGRRGLNRFLTGSIAEEIIRKAPCPVLSVKYRPATPKVHARPGEVVNVRPLGIGLQGTPTTAVVKAEDLEIIRMVVPAGKEIAAHQAKGEMTIQCLEGKISFTALGKSHELEAGQMFYLPKHETYSIKGIQDASLLMTLSLPK